MSEQDQSEKPQGSQVAETPPAVSPDQKPREHGGPKGLEPTRYNDWERNGRCIDF